jgi:SAM-dependent methyltransferase
MLKADIYDYTRRYIDTLGPLQGMTVIDVPAGRGLISLEFMRRGARVIALDLYPEKIEADVKEKLFVDMNSRFPLEDAVGDIVLCQEGIEHIPNQLALMQELNRILKPGGKLIITSPSLSHVRARLSMLLLESEYWKRLPASEVDSVWFSEHETDRIYYGHFFLRNANQLRVLTVLSGFEIEARLRTAISPSSLVLLIIAFPLICLVTLLATVDSYRKNRSGWTMAKKAIYLEQIGLNLSPVTLLCKDFFWVLRKKSSLNELRKNLKSFTR